MCPRRERIDATARHRWAGARAAAARPRHRDRGGGLGLVRARDEGEVRALEAGDPAIQAKLGMHYEILPMPRLVY